MLISTFNYRHEWKDLSEEAPQRKIKTAENSIFGNNFNVTNDDIPPPSKKIFGQSPCGPIDCIIFFGIHIYNISNAVVRLILAIQSICGNVLDSVIQRYISLCVVRSLTPSKISNLIELLNSM